jgi:hypothetical protein
LTAKLVDPDGADPPGFRRDSKAEEVENHLRVPFGRGRAIRHSAAFVKNRSQ